MKQAIKKSIINDRIEIVSLSGMTPLEAFEEFKDLCPDFDAEGNELNFDWNEIGENEYDMWAISEDEPSSSENYFCRINVRIE
jgi:hypothetical protein